MLIPEHPINMALISLLGGILIALIRWFKLSVMFQKRLDCHTNFRGDQKYSLMTIMMYNRQAIN